jgi:hypothetical protein
MKHGDLILSSKRSARNIAKWPEGKPGYSVIFKPYGKKGSGYYLVVNPLPLP